MHAGIGSKQELVEVLVGHVVIQDLPCCLLHVYVIRRVRHNDVCLHTIHQLLVGSRIRGVPAEDDVTSQMPEVSCLGEGRILQFLVHIKVILFDFFRRHLVKELLHLRRLEAGERGVEVARLKIMQKICQKVFVPCTGDLVERNVQGLLSGFIDVDDGAGNLGVAEIHRNSQSLMSSDDRHIGIHHQRIRKAKLLNGVLDLLVFFIARLQFLSRIVGCRFQILHWYCF